MIPEPPSSWTARAMLTEEKTLVKQYTNSGFIGDLLRGDVHLAMAWSGDAMQAAWDDPRLSFAIPREGAHIWVDNLCLVKGSRQREQTLRLVDHLLDPEVGAEIANTVRYATPNAKPETLQLWEDTWKAVKQAKGKRV